jgi:hypothetical protein
MSTHLPCLLNLLFLSFSVLAAEPDFPLVAAQECRPRTGLPNFLHKVSQPGAELRVGSFGGSITAQFQITSYSDARLKENVFTVDNALAKVLKLRGVYYNRIDDESKTRKLGVIAQEIEKVIPEVVVENPGGEDKVPVLTVEYGTISALLIEAIKDQQKIIDEQSSRIERLEALVDKLLK